MKGCWQLLAVVLVCFGIPGVYFVIVIWGAISFNPSWGEVIPVGIGVFGFLLLLRVVIGGAEREERQERREWSRAADATMEIENQAAWDYKCGKISYEEMRREYERADRIKPRGWRSMHEDYQQEDEE